VYTDTTNAPKIMLEYEPDRPEGITFLNTFIDTANVVHTYRQVTTRRWEFRGLTQAAADSIAARLTDTNTTAKSARASDAGHYNVSVVEQTRTGWSPPA